jgi:hypothetical protein
MALRAEEIRSDDVDVFVFGKVNPSSRRRSSRFNDFRHVDVYSDLNLSCAIISVEKHGFGSAEVIEREVPSADLLALPGFVLRERALGCPQCHVFDLL